MIVHVSRQTDKRVPIALGMLAAVVTLLGVHQVALPGAGPAADQPVQMDSTMVSSPAH